MAKETNVIYYQRIGEWRLWIVAALNGIPLGAKFIADSILSDIIDYDEFLTGQRSQATYCRGLAAGAADPHMKNMEI